MDAVSGPNFVMYESENEDNGIALKMLFRQPIFQSVLLFTTIVIAQSVSVNHGVVR
jgi:hypothetical protein